MDPQERYQLVTRNTEEIVTAEDLMKVLEKPTPTGYIGFEPSGLVHIGWMVCAQKVKDFTDAGFEFIVFFADWHAYINDKLGGNIENIRTCAKYMEECFLALGVPKDKVRFVLASEIMDINYWERVIKVGKTASLSRVKRALSIMGRTEEEGELDSSKFIYPLMQAADIFVLNVDVAYAGIDQRRAHMLAREAAEKAKWKTVAAVHTPLIPGLKGGNRMDPVAAKMSKSDPESSLLVHDSPEDIKRKLGKAFCPPEVEGNPILGICKNILFQRSPVFVIDRPEKFGGRVEFQSYEELEAAYLAQKIHPMDLKNATAAALAVELVPVREHFAKHPENMEKVKSIIAELKALR
jgi:tyrosyl-tRNA synthetase